MEEARKLDLVESPMRRLLDLDRLDRIERQVQAVLGNASAAGDHPTVLAAADRLLKIGAERRALGPRQDENADGDEVSIAQNKARAKLRIVK